MRGGGVGGGEASKKLQVEDPGNTVTLPEHHCPRDIPAVENPPPFPDLKKLVLSRNDFETSCDQAWRSTEAEGAWGSAGTSPLG